MAVCLSHPEAHYSVSKATFLFYCSGKGDHWGGGVMICLVGGAAMTEKIYLCCLFILQ